MSAYYDRAGNPVDMMTWARSIEDHKSKIVRQDTIDGWFVSTVWLGLDHSFGVGPPLIFETMIFPPNSEPRGGELDHWQEQYTTEDQARDGHERAVSMVREHLDGAW